LLDLFCGAGGAAMGYHRAGWEVVGVDIAPQPNYPFEFHQGDALEYLTALRALVTAGFTAAFDAVHASPPCQAHVRGFAALNDQLGRGTRVSLIDPTRELLRAGELPYVIENVEGAPLINPVRLCGSSFRLPLRRHRLFESNIALMVPPCDHSWQTEKRYWSSFRGDGRPQFESRVVQVYGNGGGSEHWADAMGIDWMTKKELAQAIPPAYTEHVGGYLLRALNVAEAVA
jgi:DNA (cytosine-5)-methyltransferase 1